MKDQLKMGKTMEAERDQALSSFEAEIKKRKMLSQQIKDIQSKSEK